MATELATRNGADMDWTAIGATFREPMPSKERQGRGGMKFNYIDARQVQDRLDEVVGPGNWSTAFRVLQLDPPAVECTLTIYGVSKADAGYSNDPDSDHETEPLKAAYSDAFKRAAVHWGIGRFLYAGKPAPASHPARPAAAPRAPMPQAAAIPPSGPAPKAEDDPLITDANAPAALEYGKLAQRAAELSIPFEVLTLPLHRSKVAAQYRALKARVDAKGVPA